MAGYDGRGAKFPLTIVRGADMAFTVTATDSDAAAVDLSAATIAGEVYDGDGTLVDTFTSAVSGAGSNIITLSFTDTETTALTSDAYTWTLWVTRGGDKRPWLAGPVRVTTSTNGGPGSSGTAVTATVDSNVAVTVSVNAIGGSGGGASALDDLTDVTITTASSGQALTYNGSAWVNTTLPGGGDLLAANNLSELTATASTARTNLGLGSAATTASTDYATAAQGSTADSASTSISNHIADTSDAHDASAISVADVATQYTATDVEAALAEVKVIADAAVTPAEAAAAYQPLATVLTNTTASYTTAEASKLSGIAAGAQVCDTTNVTAAGALMDSEVDADIKTLSLPANTTISTFGASLVDDADQSTARTTLGLGTMATAAAADYLPLVAAGASVENIGAVESNVQTVGATGATETLDTSVYGVFDMTMDEACEFTFSNPAPSGKATIFTLILRGAFTPTLPASIDWGDASAPTYATPSIYVFTTVDGGTIWLGSQVGKAFG